MTIGFPSRIEQPDKKSGCMKWLAAELVIIAVFALIFSCTASEDGSEAPATTTATSKTETAISTTGADT